MKATNLSYLGQSFLSVGNVQVNGEYAILATECRIVLPVFEMTREPKADRRRDGKGATV